MERRRFLFLILCFFSEFFDGVGFWCIWVEMMGLLVCFFDRVVRVIYIGLR